MTMMNFKDGQKNVTVTKARKTIGLERVDFDCRDNKGRELGAVIQRMTVELEDVPADWDFNRSFNNRAAGIYSVVDVQTTRERERWGACQPDNYFVSEAEMEAYISRRLNTMRKAAQKLAAS